MTVLRPLLWPFHPSSLMFVVLCAALLAVTALLRPEAAILRIIPAFFLLSWLFNYAFAMLDDAANGRPEPPVPSSEMLGPFEARPLLQLALCAVVYKAVTLSGIAVGSAILVIYLLLLPASLGRLGVTREVTSAINPLALVRTAWALGWYYLLILVLIASYAYAYFLLNRMSLWTVASYALLELAVLSIFSLIGAAMFVRRVALDFEPHSSPEWKAAGAEADRLKRRSQVLDEVYGFIRLHDSRRAAAPLRQWLSGLEAEQLAGDVQAIMSQAAQWNSDRGLAEVAQCLVSDLIKVARVDLALETLETTLAQYPRHALESENESVALARQARATGKPQLARTIINNFAARTPRHDLGAAAATLLRELES
jgi:hypothetical protein